MYYRAVVGVESEKFGDSSSNRLPYGGRSPALIVLNILCRGQLHHSTLLAFSISRLHKRYRFFRRLHIEKDESDVSLSFRSQASRWRVPFRPGNFGSGTMHVHGTASFCRSTISTGAALATIPCMCGQDSREGGSR